MGRKLNEIATEFDSLTKATIEDAHGMSLLYDLCEELSEVNDPANCAPVLFRTMERLDGADLGDPGPIVHTLETWPEVCKSLLADSVRRKPVLHTVWMVNRILNADPPDYESWLALLRSVTKNRNASAETKALAREFIEYQENERD